MTIEERLAEKEAELVSLSRHLDLALPMAARACQIEAENASLREQLRRDEVWGNEWKEGARLNFADLKQAEERIEALEGALGEIIYGCSGRFSEPYQRFYAIAEKVLAPSSKPTVEEK